MSWSLGEIRSLSVKATRGSGMDWGIAEEAGFAVQWLEAHGLHGVRALAQYLSRVHRNDDCGDELCPIKLGCMISDMNDWTLLEDKECHEPMLLIPFIANIIKDETLLLKWGSINLMVRINGVSTDDHALLVSRPSSSRQRLSIKLYDAPFNALGHKTRVSEEEASYVAILNALAHKTYAPATEASRLAGAGAGLNDND